VADDHRTRLAWLRERGRELRAEFAFVEGEYRAGRLALREEAALLTDITREMTALTRELCAVVRASPPVAMRAGPQPRVSARDRRGDVYR
jgi:hypothetical protein